MGSKKKPVFKIVYLLAIAAIVLILLYPVLRGVIGTDDGALRNRNRCLVRLDNVSQGVCMYKYDKGSFPAQEYVLQAASRPTTQGHRKMTTSELLARALFDDQDGKFPAATYAEVTPADLITFNGVANLISDRYGDPMPILYYPSRIGVEGVDQYDESDNAAITSGHTGGDFKKFIADPKGSKDGRQVPYRPREFLLIAAGADRLYFTKDDIANFPTE